MTLKCDLKEPELGYKGLVFIRQSITFSNRYDDSNSIYRDLISNYSNKLTNSLGLEFLEP